MNEEISRILALLEQGSITAVDAEKLIRALIDAQWAANMPRPAPRFDPFHELHEAFQCIGHAVKTAARRQRRMAIYRFFLFFEWQEQQRRQRAATMTTLQRIVHVLKEIVVVETGEALPADRLADLLPGPLAWANLRFGLEGEFRISIPTGTLEAIETVEALAAYIDTHAE